MSRGGRGGGGAGGFRGGGFRGGGKSGGANVPWTYDPEIKPDYKPSELFPPLEQPKPTPLTRLERLQVARYRAFRDRVHEGPLYTVGGSGGGGLGTVVGGRGAAATGDGGNPFSKPQVDPFEDMPTYTQKYRKKRQRMPRLDTRPYVLEFFPPELWTTLDPSHSQPKPTDANDRRRQQQQQRRRIAPAKMLMLSRGDDFHGDGPLGRLEGVDDDEDDDEEDDADEEGGSGGKKRRKRRRTGEDDEDEDDADAGADGEQRRKRGAKGDGEGNDEDEDENDEDEPPDEEEVDNDFEEDEEDMGEDYNAQTYYEDADEFGGDDYDAGGDDEGGYM